MLSTFSIFWFMTFWGTSVPEQWSQPTTQQNLWDHKSTFRLQVDFLRYFVTATKSDQHGAKKKNHSVGNRNQKWPTDSSAGVCVSALRGVCTKLCSPPKFVLLQGTVYLCKLLEMIVKARSHLEHRFLCMHTYGYKCICTNVGAHQILEPSKLRRYLLKRQGMFAFARDLKQTGWVTGRHVKEAKLKPPSLVF